MAGLKGQITEEGILQIFRGKEFKFQWCMFDTQGPVKCGDHCPLFGEPSLSHTEVRVEELKHHVTLSICGKVLDFEDFDDWRV